MGKAVVPEATARQAVAFVLGAVAALTVVMLVQYRVPAAGLRSPGHLSGQRSVDHRRVNITAELTVHQELAEGEGQDHLIHQANATMKDHSTDTRAAAVKSDHPPSIYRQEEGAEEFRGLAEAVARAAMDDRTVIMTCVNQGWAAPGSLLDLFLESFRIGDGTARLLPHVLVISMDPPSYARCLTVHQHCYHYTMPAVRINFTSDNKFFGTEEWLDLVWSKLKIQRRILELGYGFLFTDVDIMWFRDPFKHVTAYADVTISSDNYFGDPDNLDNLPNTGFFHMKPNVRTVAMTKLWYDSRDSNPGFNEQPVFNIIKKRLVEELGVRLRYMDPVHMGGFCSHGKDLGKVVTMHANCCIGLENKMKDLRSVLDDWKNYMKMPPWEKHTAKWTVPGACIK